MSFLSRASGVGQANLGQGSAKVQGNVFRASNQSTTGSATPISVSKPTTNAGDSNGFPDLWYPTQEVPVSDTNTDAVTRRCSAEGCGSSWMKPWKSRKRPVFEGGWGCSAKCILSMVRAAVRREAGEGISSKEDVPHRHRVPLGLVLLAQGWITHPQLQTALEQQRKYGEGRIGDWLVHSCGLEQERVTRGLGVQWSVPVFTTGGFSPERMALVMPKRFVAEFGLVPLRIAGSRMLYLGAESVMDAAAALAIEHMSGIRVESGLIGTPEFLDVKAKLLAATGVPVTVSTASDIDDITAQICKVLDQSQPVASKLVRVHQYLWLRTWLETGALSGTGQIPANAEDVKDTLFALA